jgi:radical SAM/Cys-rich protein
MQSSPDPGRSVLPLVADDGGKFATALRGAGLGALRRREVSTLQVNVGKLCNQACHHCHVDAGPKRTEVMSPAVAGRVIELLGRSPEVGTVDLTGGAPELCPSFRWLVTESRRLGRAVIDRCNLTILLQPGMEDLVDFLATNAVHIIASLPCYGPANVDKQRGRGVFDASMEALRRLNARGYAQAGTGLELDLVYNPLGPTLPPPQASLQQRYKDELASRFGIAFDKLLTITNMPIRRFAEVLARTGQHQAYMSLLVEHFNPATVGALMCRSLVSVSWDGRLYDCDFNQMLELPLASAASAPTVWDIGRLDDLAEWRIATADHCFGCTAGAGSSCAGALE